MITRKKPSGEYIIYREEPDTVYSTNSIFWYCFFTNMPLPGTIPHIKPGPRTDWSIITFNGRKVE